MINENSILFDGVNEFVNVPNNAALDFDGTEEFSVSIWLKKGAGTGTLLGKMSATFAGYALTTSNTVATFFHVNTLNTNEIRKTFTFSSILNTWSHVVLTYDGSQSAAGAKLYLNGSEIIGSTVNDSLTATTANTSALGFGGIPSFVGTLPFSGNIDEPAIFNIELTSGEVTELYNSGKPADVSKHSQLSGLVSWWRMGDGDTFPTITDQIASNDGTMTNAEAGDIEEDVP